MIADHGDFLLTREVTASLDKHVELPFPPALVVLHLFPEGESARRVFHWKIGSPKLALQTHRLSGLSKI
jgi:hypothetical protein